MVGALATLLVLTPAAAAPTGSAVVAFSDPGGDASTSQVGAPTYGGGALDLRSVRLEVARGTLRVVVGTTGTPALAEMSGYDVTMRAKRPCAGTVHDDGFPFEVRFRRGADGAPHALVRGCGRQLDVPLAVTGRSMAASVPLAALPALRGADLDAIRADAGVTDFPFDGTMRLAVDDARTDLVLRVP